MKALINLVPAVVVVFAIGCADNTLSAVDDESYEVELRFSEDHLATLDHVEIEVFVRDGQGRLVTSIPELQVEYRIEGAADWSSISLAVHGDHYAADHQFMTSGEHEFRVLGAIDDHSDHLDVMFAMDGHMEIERAHMEMDGMRISYENYPGHIHEGDEAELRFWIEQMSGDGHSGGHSDSSTMMAGLSATVTCIEADGSSETHTADEHESGVYEAHHTFAVSGESTMMVSFMQGGMAREASFSIPVRERH